jgi:predicted GIY-YIG superfamily endonuclease
MRDTNYASSPQSITNRCQHIAGWFARYMFYIGYSYEFNGRHGDQSVQLPLYGRIKFYFGGGNWHARLKIDGDEYKLQLSNNNTSEYTFGDGDDFGWANNKYQGEQTIANARKYLTTIKNEFVGTLKHLLQSVQLENDLEECSICNRFTICTREERVSRWYCESCLENAKKPPSSDEYVVYIMGNDEFGIYKIGLTKNLAKRFGQIKTGMPFTIKIIHWIECGAREDAYSLERNLHNMMRAKRMEGEWFTLTDSDLAELKRIE